MDLHHRHADKIATLENELDALKNDITHYIELNTELLNAHIAVTRLEVIEEGVRAYAKWHTRINLDYQDNGRTLKVFIVKE